MERTVTIDGRAVRFRATAPFIFIYRNAFQRDGIVDIFAAMRGLIPILQLASLDAESIDPAELAAMTDTYDSEIMLNLMWAFAKNADPDIPDRNEWAASFKEFPFFQISNELFLHLMPALISKQASQKKTKARRTKKSRPNSRSRRQRRAGCR